MTHRLPVLQVPFDRRQALLLGAAAGVAVAKKDGQGAVIGGLLGAAAGSYVGCQKQREQQAQAYDTNDYAYGAGAYERYDGYQQAGYGDRMPLARGVQPAHMIAAQERLRVARNVNLRAGPSASSAKVGQLSAGQTFESLGMVRGTDWLLVGRNGVGVGYVKQSYVQPADYGRYAGGYGR
jgi:hypothetical protein